MYWFLHSSLSSLSPSLFLFPLHLSSLLIFSSALSPFLPISLLAVDKLDLRFEEPFYLVEEGIGFLEVCVVPQDGTGQIFQLSQSLNISTEDITATG